MWAWIENVVGGCLCIYVAEKIGSGLRGAGRLSLAEVAVAVV